MQSYIKPESGGPFVDQVLVLQNYAEGWTDGKWEEKVDERPCVDKLMYSKDKQGFYRYHNTLVIQTSLNGRKPSQAVKHEACFPGFFFSFFLEPITLHPFLLHGAPIENLHLIDNDVGRFFVEVKGSRPRCSAKNVRS